MTKLSITVPANVTLNEEALKLAMLRANSARKRIVLFDSNQPFGSFGICAYVVPINHTDSLRVTNNKGAITSKVLVVCAKLIDNTPRLFYGNVNIDTNTLYFETKNSIYVPATRK
jgi:hypothetical protein